jgi:hypothetical protein
VFMLHLSTICVAIYDWNLKWQLWQHGSNSGSSV